MSLDPRRFQRYFSSRMLAWQASSLLAVIVALVFSGTTSASIIMQEARPFVLAASSLGAPTDSCGSSSAPLEQQTKDSDRYQTEQFHLLGLDSPQPGGTTSGSSSAPGNGAGGVNASALGLVSAFVLCDADVIRWIAGEQRLALPTPPGNDLLRPPQAV